MTVCKFWKQGNCRNGSSCRFEHPGNSYSADNKNNHSNNQNQNQNRFGALGSNNNNNGGNSGYSTNANSRRWNIVPDEVKKDLTAGSGRPNWILSAYGPGKDAPESLLKENEYSPEEVRLRFYEAVQLGKQEEANQEAIQLWGKATDEMKNVASKADDVIKFMDDAFSKKPNRYTFCKMDGRVSAEEVRNTAQQENVTIPSNDNPFGRSTTFGPSPFAKQPSFGQTPAPSAFGNNNVFGKPAQSSAFGQPAFGQPTQSASPFGQLSQATPAFGQSSAFGGGVQPTASPFGGGAPSNVSPFGGGVQGNASPFGAGAQNNVSTFGGGAQGSASPFGGNAASNAFAKPSASAGFGQMSQPAFGQATQPGGTFGQQAQGKSPFGQPLQSSGGFGQRPAVTSAFGQPSNPGLNASPFGGIAPSNTPFGQPAQNNPISVPEVSMDNPDSRPPTQGNAFNTPSQPQPTQPTSNFTTTPNTNTNAALPAPVQSQSPNSAPINPLTSRPSHPLHYTQTLPFAPPTKSLSGNLSTFRGQQVQTQTIDPEPNDMSVSHRYDLQTYSRPDRRGAERIWFPDMHAEESVRYLNGGADRSKIADLQAADEHYTDAVKSEYAHLFTHGAFRAGKVPTVAPRREWVDYDF